MPLIHLNILQLAPFICCVMYNLWQQQCLHGSVLLLLCWFQSIQLLCFNRTLTNVLNYTSLELRKCQFSLYCVYMIESVI